MCVGIVNAEEERRLTCIDERGGMLRVFVEVASLEVRFREFVKLEGKRGLGIDVQLADDAGAIPHRFQVAWQVRRVLPIEAKIPGRESDLAMLMRIQPGHNTRATLAAARLCHEGAIKADPLTSQAVEIRRACVWISIAA